ncbi:MAG TPA: UbiX family flavin prenyltransferase [Gammaproteobacteria bacterium]|nr:UbiX family flavin prenyltransferase [Gammaproteobacteria bacterium]
MSRHAIALAMTGASGAAYGLRLLECLLQLDQQVYFLVSAAARVVISMETDRKLPARPTAMAASLSKHYGARPGQLTVFGRDQWTAPLASGSSVPRAMVICPCTSGTLAAVAQGHSNDLLERAADVVLKERRPLILVPREAPYSVIHLENMLKLARMGATVLPASPGFYHRPDKVADLVDFIVARILDQLHLEHELVARWG